MEWRSKARWLKRQTQHPLTRNMLLAVPVIVFFLPLLLTGDRLIAGDGDYYVQLYEAMRRTILEFHQFPWWNPWIAGGVPLFANPQFGLVSIQSLFVLPFGAAMGYKLGLLSYALLGFFGFKRLFQTVTKTDLVRAALLGYIWCFGSFVVYRIGGHYTFLMIGLTPWVFYYYAMRHQKYGWLKLSLIVSLMLWTAVHYITMITLLLLVLLFARRFVRLLWMYGKDRKIKPLLEESRVAFKFVLTTLALCSVRLYFVFQYLGDFPRKQTMYEDPYFGIGNGLYAIFGPDQYIGMPRIDSPWHWLEASAYVGIGTGILFVYVLWLFITKKIKFSVSPYLLFVPLVVFFVLGLGDFGNHSPFHILRELPYFESLRVAPRWFMWTALVCLGILAAAKLNGQRLRVARVLLLAAVVELFVVGFPYVGKGYTHNIRRLRGEHAAFEQHLLWKQQRAGRLYPDENFTEATRNNVGQVIIGDPLIDTRGPVKTIRCPVEHRCTLATPNAQITYWSPNRLVLQRVAKGPIELQMNPGKKWRVNDAFPFGGLKMVDPSQRFIITDPSPSITVEYVPPFSPAWVKGKLEKF